jgi:predicted AAA+ superfamily ATPase
MLLHLSNWYGVSQREVIDYLDILSKDDIINILMKYGLTEKESKKLLK